MISLIISASDFVDFINKSGTAKITKVKGIYKREQYHPSKDFYKKLRDLIVVTLKEERGIEEILDFIDNEAHPKKKPHYRAIFKGYQKFIMKENPKWVSPNNSFWEHGDLKIKINPEIGLALNNKKYLVKLYFKDSKMSQSEIKCALRLMESHLCKGAYKGYNVALLDLRKGKLYENKSLSPEIDDLLEGEAESLIRIWRGLTKE